MKHLMDQVDGIIERFDFQAVHDYMLRTDWQWESIGGVPGIPVLKETARELLESVASGTYVSNSSGGFRASLHFTDNTTYLKLTFEICEEIGIIQ